jgi:hypothetical protein
MSQTAETAPGIDSRQAKIRQWLNPEWRPARLGRLDRRTWQAQLLRDTRAELCEHLGGKPSATQMALIDRIAQLRLHLALFDLKFARRDTISRHDSRTYLAWSNSYGRLLRLLGLESAPVPEPNWNEWLASRGEPES